MTADLANTPVLETERLILRAPQASDFEHFAPFAQLHEVHFQSAKTVRTTNQS